MWVYTYTYAYNQRRQWHPTPVLLPGKSHGRRSLVGCSPWGRQESDTTEWLYFHFSLSCIGEGNCNPLQCSCLENPRDGGAWWPAVYGVAQSRTQLKQLSSSMPIIYLHIHNPYYTISERIYKTLTILENGGGWWERKTYFSLYILSCFSFVPCTNITYSQLFSKKKFITELFPCSPSLPIGLLHPLPDTNPWSICSRHLKKKKKKL